MENNGNRAVSSHILFKQSEEQLNQELLDHMAVVKDVVDSPKFLLIMRNAILTLLETPDEIFSWKAVHSLLTEQEFRASVVKRLEAVTPQLWRDEWDKLWKVDEDPLFSKAQQRIVKRHSLIVYWRDEWDTLPKKERMHAARVAEMLAD